MPLASLRSGIRTWPISDTALSPATTNLILKFFPVRSTKAKTTPSAEVEWGPRNFHSAREKWKLLKRCCMVVEEESEASEDTISRVSVASITSPNSDMTSKWLGISEGA